MLVLPTKSIKMDSLSMNQKFLISFALSSLWEDDKSYSLCPQINIYNISLGITDYPLEAPAGLWTPYQVQNLYSWKVVWGYAKVRWEYGAGPKARSHRNLWQASFCLESTGKCQFCCQDAKTPAYWGPLVLSVSYTSIPQHSYSHPPSPTPAFQAQRA